MTKDGRTPGGLAALRQRRTDLMTQLGMDEAKARRNLDLTRAVAEYRRQEEEVTRQLAHAAGSEERIAAGRHARLAAYEVLFDALESERAALSALYTPLQEAIARMGSVAKLSFRVRRHVDLAAWLKRADAVIDYRKYQRAALEEKAMETLFPAWMEAAPAEVRRAMESFVDEVGVAAFRARLPEVAVAEFGRWLFSTEHIRVHYSVEYEDTPLERLSPGARGVVLMMLYLGLDRTDRRPLLIDQPEENLDPRSVHSELVGFFRNASRRRQIIMVTHNANLVVNTDSDQVVVAKSERLEKDGLPRITYTAGALETSRVHKEVCRLLEGGKTAFRQRGRRYGII